MSFNTIIDWNGCSADQQLQLLTRPAISASDSISKTVTEILNNVKANGDAALREYSAKFDKTTVAALQVSEAEIAAAGERLSDELKQAMAVAVKTLRPSTTRNSCRRWMSNAAGCAASRSPALSPPSDCTFPAAQRRCSPRC